MIAPGGGKHLLGGGRRGRRGLYWAGGFLVGWVTGVITLLALAGMSVRFAPQGQVNADPTDVRVQISAGYLNDVVRRRLAASPQVVVGSIKTVDLRLGLLPQAGMVLTPTFEAAGLLRVSPSVSNQLAVRDGKIAMSMIGQPRLGDLQIPLDMLPFDLTGEVHAAVDQITNSVLLAELNDNLKAGFGSDTFVVTDVQTEGNDLAIRLKRK